MVRCLSLISPFSSIILSIDTPMTKLKEIPVLAFSSPCLSVGWAILHYLASFPKSPSSSWTKNSYNSFLQICTDCNFSLHEKQNPFTCLPCNSNLVRVSLFLVAVALELISVPSIGVVCPSSGSPCLRNILGPWSPLLDYHKCFPKNSWFPHIASPLQLQPHP